MKRRFKVAGCLAASLMMASGAFAENVTLYSLDNRTLVVAEDLVEAYTKEGMGWYKEKPVEMYAEDGRTIVVAADQVEAYKEVGWFVSENKTEEEPAEETAEKEEKATEVSGKAIVEYIEGTRVTVPAKDVEKYIELGWEDVTNQAETVTMRNADGVTKEIKLSDVERYELAGWVKVESGAPSIDETPKPGVNYVTLYLYDGSTKSVEEGLVEEYKAKGYYPAFDEAVYAYAAFGNGVQEGTIKLIENKKYEQAYTLVREALDKIENTESEYVSMLYYLRTLVTDSWREAANSPLGFLNYWFQESKGKTYVVFEYRNVSNSRIKSFRINFDICDEAGNIIETNEQDYIAENLEMIPCEKKRVAWLVESGNKAKSVKNVRVTGVVFSDNTKWSR